MGDGAHGQWDTWAIGHMIITSLILDIDIDVFYLNIQSYSHDGLFKYKKLRDLKF